MPPKKQAPDEWGLRLTLPGATGEPYHVAGAPGLYRRDTPRPVGGDGEMSVDAARALADTCDILELVDMTATEAAAARGVFDADHQAATSALRDAVRHAAETGTTDEETERIADQAAALNALKEA